MAINVWVDSSNRGRGRFEPPSRRASPTADQGERAPRGASLALRLGCRRSWGVAAMSLPHALLLGALAPVAAAAAAAAAAAGMVVHADAPIASISPYMVGAVRPCEYTAPCRPQSAPAARAPQQHYACSLTRQFSQGIEDVNHELIGGISTQLVWGESFEEPGANSSRGVSAAGTNGHPTWLPTDSSAPDCEFELVRGIAAKTGLQSQFIAGTGCGVRNRGLDFGGHSFVAGEAYAGHLFAKGDSASTIEVSLADWSTNTTLARQTLAVPAGDVWAMHNITLTPTAGTRCSTTAVGADRYKTCAGNAENLCPICNGEFRIVVRSGAVLLDQVFLEQVSLRFADQPTRKSVVSLMKDTMGFGVLRNGGSQCNSNGYRWKGFRGEPEVMRFTARAARLRSVRWDC